MAKIVESKLIISGDASGGQKAVESMTRALEAMASMADNAAQRMEAVFGGGVGGGGGGGRGGGRPSAQSGRSPYAPSGGGGVVGRRGRTAPTTTGEMEFEELTLKKEKSNLMRNMGRAGQMIGAGQTLLGGAVGNMTATAGGMLMSAGGAITGIAGGLGGFAGLPMMAAGGLMGLTAMLAQPAIQHYGTNAGTYRRLGEARSSQLKAMFSAGTGFNAKTGELEGQKGRYAGVFSPEEQIQYASNLERIGGFNALGVMAGMRGGGFEPETMMPFFETATRTGAAGARGVQNYEFLGKVITKSFKDSGMTSMTQGIETLTGIMDISSQYLADISDTDTKALAAFVKVGDLSGTAALKGQRAVQAFGMLAGGMKTQDPAMQQLLWNIFSKARPGMSWYEMESLKQTPSQSIPLFLEGMGKLDPKQAATLMYGAGMVPSLPIGEKIARAYGQGGIEQAIKSLTPEELAATGLDYTGKGKGAKPGGVVDTATQIQLSKNLNEQMGLEISSRKGITSSYFKMEGALKQMTAAMIGKEGEGGLIKAIAAVASGLDAMARKLNGEVSPRDWDSRLSQGGIGILEKLWQLGYGLGSEKLTRVPVM